MKIKTYQEYKEKYFPKDIVTKSEEDIMSPNLARKALEKSQSK